MNRIQFLFNEDLFLKIKGSRILLDQGVSMKSLKGAHFEVELQGKLQRV